MVARLEPTREKEMNQYYIYRLEQGLSAAERRATDQRMSELAAALTQIRATLAHGVGRGLGTLRALRRVNNTRELGCAAAAALARR